MSDQSPIRWHTAITSVHGDDVRVRGYPLLELAEKVDFASVCYLLFKGELPTPAQAKVLNALMVALCDHGVAPNEAVSRIIAACGSPLQAAIAAGVLTVGDIYGGAGEAVARRFEELMAQHREGKTIEQIADEHVLAQRAAGRRVEGFGHPLHPDGDPRATFILGLADRLGVSGEYVALARAIERAVEKHARRRIPMNIDGASAAVLADLGLDWRFARAWVIIPRAAGLAAHAVEESVRERGWRIVAAEDEVAYDGPPPRNVP